MKRIAGMFLLLGLLPSGCATFTVIPGTKVVDTKVNREILDICEKYRHALEDRDGATLLALASPNYYEDSGTPKGDDDYGYEGLKEVLQKRLAALRTVRYNIEYRKVDVEGRRAKVDIRYDASFQIATEMGDRWERKQNDKRIELEHDGHRWLILAGM
jgi:hypothetical protein